MVTFRLQLVRGLSLSKALPLLLFFCSFLLLLLLHLSCLSTTPIFVAFFQRFFGFRYFANPFHLRRGTNRHSCRCVVLHQSAAAAAHLMPRSDAAGFGICSGCCRRCRSSSAKATTATHRLSATGNASREEAGCRACMRIPVAAGCASGHL